MRSASAIGTSMDWMQAYSFMLFTLMYTPCLSTIATLRSESHRSGSRGERAVVAGARLDRELRLLSGRAAAELS